MKILFFTDSHIRGTTPKNRKDVFIDTIEKKFKEIISLSKNLNVDFILHGGDLFDRPDISISIVSRFAKLLSEINVPFYLISGNHDIFGHNPNTINRTMLGLLDVLNIINIVESEETIVLSKGDISVQLTGQPYIYDLDSPNNLKYYTPTKINPECDYSIHMVHGMLLDKPFIKGVPHTLIESLKDTLADITLSGHYHSGFKTTMINGKYFVNPGSMVRITNSLEEIKRKPSVILIEFNENINIKEINLKTALPGIDVLDREEIEKSMFESERILEFKQTIDAALNFEKMDINEVLIEVSSASGVEEEVKIEALRRIAVSQMKGLNGD